MNTLVRAIITGFGLRIGSELGKLVAKKLIPHDEAKDGGDEGEGEDDSLQTINPDGPQL
ncbi:hypothetical protein G6O69_02145 [Pseudenhygromyxa sp. WMMC2535]|uniref:hypothetical protein n=1 Tax=Pseudenhygromyxa sp. WMMC2535 TaxID=2712867 RepID=UPI001552662D|nr:hypothetical protein [Pseudenhygromyxa sp. WMMC2535]NVB36616.1 hypothetical protein [Pseudenhygromyxa sp. WMMC2535]